MVPVLAEAVAAAAVVVAVAAAVVCVSVCGCVVCASRCVCGCVCVVACVTGVRVCAAAAAPSAGWQGSAPLGCPRGSHGRGCTPPRPRRRHPRQGQCVCPRAAAPPPLPSARRCPSSAVVEVVVVTQRGEGFRVRNLLPVVVVVAVVVRCGGEALNSANAVRVSRAKSSRSGSSSSRGSSSSEGVACA